MKKQKISPIIGAAFAVLILFIVFFMVRGSLHRPDKIVLPPEQSDLEPGDPITGIEAINRVEVRPDTVQRVIETLTRPTVYKRIIRVERYWEGGSSAAESTVTVAGQWRRVDTVMHGGEEVRHTITGSETSWIWYGTAERCFSASALFEEDAEQGIPTYEDILFYSIEQIAAADYRALEGLSCIYVETFEDEEGYVERYWVDVASGLLVAAERECEGAVVYRMAALEMMQSGAATEDFTLPDGTILYEIKEERKS